MDPIIAAMLISSITDAIITVCANASGESPEEFKKKVEALQVKADDLEDWLRNKK